MDTVFMCGNYLVQGTKERSTVEGHIILETLKDV